MKFALNRRLSEFLLPAMVFAILLVYTAARFYAIGYVGFQYQGNTAEIVEIYVSGAPFEVGDKILAVNGIFWGDEDAGNPIANAQPGSVLELTLDGEAAQRTVRWITPGFNYPEFFSRLVNTWVISYIFWLAGTATLFFLRPKDVRWALLIAFDYITAIWLITGGIAQSGVVGSASVFRLAIWIAVPIYIQLHWNIPRAFRPISNRFWIGLYGVAILLAAMQLLALLSWDMHLAAFAFAAVASLGLLGYRYVTRKHERGEIGLLFMAAVVALMPAIAVALNANEPDLSTQIAGYLLSLIALPGAYFYVISRRRLGGLELRANRLISLYLFLVLLVTLALVVLPLVFTWVPDLRQAGGAIVLTIVFTSLLTVIGFERFQRFVERRLLKIPQPPANVMENFANRVSTSFSRTNLADVLRAEVMPAFLIRQSALVDFEARDEKRAVYVMGVEGFQIPSNARLTQMDRSKLEEPSAPDWWQVVVPLRLGDRLRGVWLLGRKDPDDFYSDAELKALRSLASQTAIALANISQAENLRALYQANVERHETERIHMARELHDDTLGRINELATFIKEKDYDKGFGQRLKDIVDQVRRMMNGLRPPLLDQGLYFALLDLVEDLSEREGEKGRIKLALLMNPVRLDPMVEQHIYRIVQQGCENALAYSEATTIIIEGKLEAEQVQLAVRDNGKGFSYDGQADLAQFLANKHFGLAGMQERAAMIGADLKVTSSLGKGTNIYLKWKQGKETD